MVAAYSVVMDGGGVPGDLTALVIAARRGDRRAFAELYRRFSRAVHGVILARVHFQNAADLVQDVFAIALERLPQLGEPAAFPGWILAIARNRATDSLRAKKPQAGEAELQALTTSDSAVRRSPEVTRVLAALRTLPEAYQETLILRLVEGLSGPEIAEQTGLSPGSVRVNLHRGMKLLREALGIEEGASSNVG